MNDKPISENIKDQYKERLLNIIAKKIKTSMIFPLSQFESIFGYMWGHGKPDEDLTEEEQLNKLKWDECRTKILDNGHKQIRNIGTELKTYDVIWKRYTARLTPVGYSKE